MVMVARLRSYLRKLGFKVGDCGYCGAASEKGKPEAEVFVKRLPNKVKACYLCYDRLGAA